MLRFENEQNPYEMRRQAIVEYIRENTSVYIDCDKYGGSSKRSKMNHRDRNQEKGCDSCCVCDYCVLRLFLDNGYQVIEI